MKKKGIKILKVKGDAKLVVKQVWYIFDVKNPRLKHYKNRVWEELEGFKAFSIKAMPQELNTRADVLARSTSLLIPHLDFKEDLYTIKLIHHSSVPNNFVSW